MSYRIFENGDNGTGDEGLFVYVLDGLRLIEKDTLGGAGSRGCGQIKFQINLTDGVIKTLDNVNSSDFPTVA